MFTSSASDAMTTQSPNVSVLLQRINEGDVAAGHSLLAVLYEELHRVAANLMRRQPPGHTLQATALVSEAYLKLMGPGEAGFANRHHFVAKAACAMRSVLVDHARKKRADKRNAPGQQEPLDQIVIQFDHRALDLIALDEALERLKRVDEFMVQAIELRFFGGLAVDEVARILDKPKRTIERQWTFAKAWLLRELSK